MYCIKCGKETKNEQVFCDACLVVMEQFPVKPGTPVHLHPRPASTSSKAASRKRIFSAEEKIQRMRGAIKGLVLALLCMVLALGLTISLLVHTASLYQEAQSIGKNYNTVSNTD